MRILRAVAKRQARSCRAVRIIRTAITTVTNAKTALNVEYAVIVEAGVTRASTTFGRVPRA
jgi:non-canonical (house-cleaning) NTP pyrophosphatase